MARGQRSDDEWSELLTLLLEHGADPNAGSDTQGAKTTLLMRAGPWTAGTLLAAGADPRLRDLQGLTALHHASTPEVIDLLLAHGMSVDLLSEETKEDPARTPLQVTLANWEDRTPIAKAFLDRGANPHAKDSYGRSAWWYCYRAAAFDLLLPYGFSLTERDSKGNSLLHNALAWSGQLLYAHYVGYFERLLAHGFDINAKDAEGNTCLHVVAKACDGTNHVETLRLLLESGANKTLTNAAGKLPWQLARKSQKEAIKLLKP